MGDLFFYSSKIIWRIISPDSLFVLLLLIAALLFYFGHVDSARRLFTGIVVMVLFLSLLPIGNWMLYPLESRFRHNPDLPEHVDGIIILGGSVKAGMSAEWQQLETNRHAERLHSFIELARKYPDARLLFTGGNASINRDKPTEADMLKRHLNRLGINPERVIIENQARNTAENAYYAKQLAKPEDGSNWILITTAFHMPRSVGLFCQTSWPVIPYPVDHQTNPSRLMGISFNLLGHANSLNLALHEWTGLLAYYLTGRISSPFPQDCRQDRSDGINFQPKILA
jgi:uncharacterized SAM-binding protein YcdF (DUF218 family)